MKKVWLVLAVLAICCGPAQATLKKTPVTDGVWRVYYPSGAIMREENYKNTDLEGRYSEYYENGKLKSTVIYKGDKRNGPAQTTRRQAQGRTRALGVAHMI